MALSGDTDRSWMLGAKRRHMMAGRPRMFGMRVVSLAMTREPSELTPMRPATISVSWLPLDSSSRAMEFRLFGSTHTALSK